MKKNENYIGTVSAVKFPNKGILTASYPAGREETGGYIPVSDMPDDCPVTVKNTIPGQKICFSVRKKRKGNLRRKLLFIRLSKNLWTSQKRKYIRFRKSYSPHYARGKTVRLCP